MQFCLSCLKIPKSGYSGLIPVISLIASWRHFWRKVQSLRPFSVKSPKPETFRGPSVSCRSYVPFFPEKSNPWLFKMHYSTLSCPVVFAHFSSSWPRSVFRIELRTLCSCLVFLRDLRCISWHCFLVHQSHMCTFPATLLLSLYFLLLWGNKVFANIFLRFQTRNVSQKKTGWVSCNLNVCVSGCECLLSPHNRVPFPVKTAVHLVMGRDRHSVFVGQSIWLSCVCTKVHMFPCLFVHICLHTTYSKWSMWRSSRRSHSAAESAAYLCSDRVRGDMEQEESPKKLGDNLVVEFRKRQVLTVHACAGSFCFSAYWRCTRSCSSASTGDSRRRDWWVRSKTLPSSWSRKGYLRRCSSRKTANTTTEKKQRSCSAQSGMSHKKTSVQVKTRRWRMCAVSNHIHEQFKKFVGKKKSMNVWVLIVTWKKTVWSTRIGRISPIWNWIPRSSEYRDVCASSVDIPTPRTHTSNSVQRCVPSSTTTLHLVGDYTDPPSL